MSGDRELLVLARRVRDLDTSMRPTASDGETLSTLISPLPVSLSLSATLMDDFQCGRCVIVF